MDTYGQANDRDQVRRHSGRNERILAAKCIKVVTRVPFRQERPDNIIRVQQEVLKHGAGKSQGAKKPAATKDNDNAGLDQVASKVGRNRSSIAVTKSTGSNRYEEFD